ncbi:Outer membrane protein beta-barrel domain-containing protein [Paracidovorax anthurii]|uniref:Uncharacterized protein n=2 Tax=Paracidovorax anthurii TaxID=78229 RepID=A0A328YAW1_9BURK|nr:hypothetical protein AX018_11076 [Paracidovorax anthurii]
MVLTAMLGPLICTGQTRDVTGEIAVSTDLTERGVFVGPSKKPIVQGLISLYDASGWSLSSALGMQSDGTRSTRAIVRAAYDGMIDNDWQYQTSVQYYAYPGGAEFRLFDRVEAAVGASFRDLLTASVSTFHYVHTRDEVSPMRWAVDLGARWPLTPHWSATGAIGLSGVRPQGRQYTYGSAGLAWHTGPWRAEFTYLKADGRARRLFTNSTSGHWSLAVIRSF